MSGIKIPKANIYPKLSLANIKKQFQPRNIVSGMASDGFLPVIALEAFVEAGRTYQAYKRGGFDEARERITEEFSGAVFWLGGVTGLNWLFEKLGQKLLKLPNKMVDIAHDETRNPLKKYLINEIKTNKNGGTISESLMAKFKFTKVIASVLIANAFIGFILPKINQAITRSYHKNDKNNSQNSSNEFISRPHLETFGQKDKDNNDTTFTGKFDLLSIANNFENKRNWKLLSVDAGTASGRAYSARNNDERVEILFRDLSSIYFYMFNMANMNNWLNQIEQGKGNSSRLDPSSAKFTTEYLQNYVTDKKVSLETFEKDVLGENNEFPESLKEKFKKHKIITLEDFKAELKNIVPEDKLSHYEKIAQQMSELQPERVITENGVSVQKRILTQGQVKDVLNGGHINNPEFLKELYANALGHRKFMDNEKYKFVPQSTFDSIKQDVTNYVKSIIEEAKKADIKEITASSLKKASKHNFKMNLINWGSGFAISALFLSTLIPKTQYLITKMRTGKDNFPGTEEYRKAV